MNRFFLQVLQMSLTAGFVIVVVLAARLALRRAPKLCSYLLWAVVLLRLLCPFSFESVLSLIPAGTQSTIGAVTALMSVGAPAGTGAGTALPPIQGPEGAVTPPAAGTAVLNVISALWFAGVAVFLLYGILSSLRLGRGLRTAVRAAESRVYETDRIRTPLVYGLLLPNIYLPLGLEGQERAYIIEHERTHIRRGDHVARAAFFAALALHWFNPLVWLAYRLMNRDMEMSCDESVMRRTAGDIRVSYSTSLLSLSVSGGLLSPLAFGESSVSGRVKNVLSWRRPTAWILLVILALVLALSVMLFADPRVPADTPNVDQTLAALATEHLLEPDMAALAESGVTVTDSSIVGVELAATLSEGYDEPLELYRIDYRLTVEDPAAAEALGRTVEDGLVTQTTADGVPYLAVTQQGHAYAESFRSVSPDTAALTQALTRATRLRLGEFYFQLTTQNRFDFVPEFEAGNPPASSSEYLMYAFILDSARYKEEPMPRDYVENVIKTHFEVQTVVHEPMTRLWNYDGSVYTPTGWSYGYEPFYGLVSSATTTDAEGRTIYDVTLDYYGFDEFAFSDPQDFTLPLDFDGSMLSDYSEGMQYVIDRMGKRIESRELSVVEAILQMVADGDTAHFNVIRTERFTFYLEGENAVFLSHEYLGYAP